MMVNRFKLVVLIISIIFSVALVVGYTASNTPLLAQGGGPGRPGDGGGGGGGGGGGNDNSDGPLLGEIRGVVTNLTTGQVVGGVKVNVNGGIVTTDAQGRYSVTGLQPGTYSVQLDLADLGNASPVQGPQLVNLPGAGLAIVDMQFIIGQLLAPTPIPTPTPVVAVPAAPAADSPPELPDSGGLAPDRSLFSVSGPLSVNLSALFVSLKSQSLLAAGLYYYNLPTALCSKIHIMRTNESLADVATTYSLTTGQILAATNMARVEHPSFARVMDFNSVSAGDQLCIPY